MSTNKIGADEWLAELERLSRRNDAGQTTQELAAAAGKSVFKMRTMLLEAMRMGWLIRGQRSTVRLDGRSNLVTVYRIARPKSGQTMIATAKCRARRSGKR